MSFIGTQTFTPRKLPIVIITFSLVALVSIMFYDSPVTTVVNYIIAGIVLLFGLLYWALLKTSITVDNDGITFQRPLKKEKIISWKQIRSVKMNWEIQAHTADLSWSIFFDNSSIKFQPSYYSRRNLKLLAEAFIAKCNGLITDKRILKIAEGIFPWYLF